MDFYNNRRPSARRDDDDRQLDRASLSEANAHIRSATPVYLQPDVNRKIRTAAVQRHRARRAGQMDFGTIGDYKNFICGTDDGSDG